MLTVVQIGSGAGSPGSGSGQAPASPATQRQEQEVGLDSNNIVITFNPFQDNNEVTPSVYKQIQMGLSGQSGFKRFK